MICTPKTLSVLLSAKILTNPSVALFTLALELARKGNLPTLYVLFSALSCYSVFPTVATSGDV
mgnify:CR=1 FL=1